MATSIVKCRKCGFVYTNPKIVSFLSEGEEFYNNPDEYLSSMCEDPLKIFDNTLNLVEKFAKKRGKMLDIGSGKGEFLAAAKRRGWEVYGVEPSEKFVKYTKDKYDLDIQNICLEKANFDDNFFDVVTLNMVLEHVDNPHKLLAGISNILKKNGLLYIEVPNMDSGLLRMINIYYRLKGKDWASYLSPMHPPYHSYGYGKYSLNCLCRMNGLEVRKFLIHGIGLRGFRSRYENNKFIQSARNIAAKIFSWTGQGDILIAMAVKQ